MYVNEEDEESPAASRDKDDLPFAGGREEVEKTKRFKAGAKEVLDYLNEVTGGDYTHDLHIYNALRYGKTVEQLKHVIDVKSKYDETFYKDHPKWINPVTLFIETPVLMKYINEPLEPFRSEEPYNIHEWWWEEK